jgi:hypothetical protein
VRSRILVTAVAVAVASGLTACGPATSPARTSPGALPSVQPATGSAEPVPPATVLVADAGLKLTATLDRPEVEAGGTITVGLSIENTRPTDVVFEEPCGDETQMTVTVQVPVEPTGREWKGIAAAFKTYALRESAGSPIESSIRTGLRTTARSQPCHAPEGAQADGGGLPTTIIPAGTTYQTVLTWTAEIVPGVPAIPGPAPFSIVIVHDQRPAAGGMTMAETLTATGTITVVDGAPSAVSAGRALDAVLADAAFAKWLAKQPQKSWANTNLFIQPRAFGVAVLPVVPYWDVELYREPRNWAVVYVDALGGQVLRRSFCNIPCDR